MLARATGYLKLPFILEHFEELAQQAAAEAVVPRGVPRPPGRGRGRLPRGPRLQRRIKHARFPVLKTLEQFDFTWPTKINRLAVQNLFRLKFIEDKANAIFIGGVGLGKSSPGHRPGPGRLPARLSAVRFTTAIDIINTLSAAQTRGASSRTEASTSARTC